MTRRTMYKITIHYVSPLSSVSDGDGFSGLELARVKLNPRHRCGAPNPHDITRHSRHSGVMLYGHTRLILLYFCLFMF